MMSFRKVMSSYAVLAGAVVAGLTIAGLSASMRGEDKAEATYTTVRPVRGNFTRTVPGAGDVRPYRPTMVYNDVRYWPRRVVEVLPQGSWVKKGDVICVLDASELTKQYPKPRLAVISDTARLAKAEAEEVLQTYLNRRNLENGKLQQFLAKHDLEAYRDGEYQNARRRLAGVMQSRQLRLDAAAGNAGTTELMVREGLVSTAGLERANRDLESASIEIDQAEGDINLMEQFMHPRRMAELEYSADDSDSELGRIELRNGLATSLKRFQSLSFRKYRAGWKQYRDYLAAAIAGSKIRAPCDGQVVYHEEDDRRIEVDQYVHYTQKIAAIIDGKSKLSVAAKISDRFFFSLETGQEVRVKLRSMPDKTFWGTLTWFGTIPSRDSKWVQTRHHKAEILLNDSEELSRVYPGMSADIEVVVAARENVIKIPSASVVEFQGNYVAVVKTESGLQRRVLDIGVASEEWMEVVHGLTEFDEVVMDSPEKLRALARNAAIGNVETATIAATE